MGINDKWRDYLDFYEMSDSPVGPLLLVSDGEALTGLYLNRQIPAVLSPLPVFDRTKDWLADYFRGCVRPVDVPIKTAGTAFQEQVWELLRQIPFGETRSYGQIAREMASRMGKARMSAQAVGQAVGRNPVSILVPCHRVVGTGGKLTGYAGGIENKQWLLRHEARMSKGNESEKE